MTSSNKLMVFLQQHLRLFLPDEQKEMSITSRCVPLHLLTLQLYVHWIDIFEVQQVKQLAGIRTSEIYRLVSIGLF